MEARYFCQLTTTEVCGNGANQYKPIRREDYQWLIDSSSSCTTPSKRQSQQWQFQTPSRSSPSNCSFNSSCFSLSKYSSPLAISPTLPTTFSKNKAKRLMKQTFIEQKECSICLDIIKKQADLPCSHSYCLECLKEWLQNATKCPYCRAEVEFFTHEGQKVRVEPKEFEFEARTDELMDWLCYQCDHTQVGDTLLICDRCDAYACHVDCDQALNGIEPQGQWYCHYCR